MFKTIINSSLDKAFILLKDLSEEVILSKKSNSSFNFETRQTSTVNVNFITKMIVVKDREETKNGVKLFVKEILLKTSAIENFSIYDTLTYRSDSWQLGATFKHTENVTLLEIYKGA